MLTYKKLFVLFAVIVLIFLATLFYVSQKPSDYTTGNTISIDGSSSVENAPLWEHEGTIVHQVRDWGDFFGLEIGFWDKPFGSRKLRFADLPEEFQKEGLKVKVKYGKHDVIGTSDWDVIIDIVDIQKI